MVARMAAGISRTVTMEIPRPSVIRLEFQVRRPRPHVKLTRREVFRRDNYTCQYCGRREAGLTVDHVVPRFQGGLHVWNNVVAACASCNHRKGGRSPDEAHMRLLHLPAGTTAERGLHLRTPPGRQLRVVRLHPRLVGPALRPQAGPSQAAFALTQSPSHHEVLGKSPRRHGMCLCGREQAGSSDLPTCRWVVNEEQPPNLGLPRHLAGLLAQTSDRARGPLLHGSGHLRPPPGAPPLRTARCRMSRRSPCCWSRHSRSCSPIVGMRWWTGELRTRKSSRFHDRCSALAQAALQRHREELRPGSPAIEIHERLRFAPACGSGRAHEAVSAARAATCPSASAGRRKHGRDGSA